MIQMIINDLKNRTELSIEAFKKDLAKYRTGRASHSLVENIRVDVYGSIMMLSQIATITVPESRMIVIQSWDSKMLGVIEKAILKSDIGVNPQNDGKIIRLHIPCLTEERRHELAKKARHDAENHKVSIRNIRREVLESLKKIKKNKVISEDDIFKLHDEVQKVVDLAISHVDKIVANKEKELMEI